MVASTSQRCFCSFSAPATPPLPKKAGSFRILFQDYNKLSKGKLSALVVATAAAGFVAGSGERIDFVNLAWTSLGTFACSAAANALNQVYEIKNDGLMRRTMLRPLPTGRLSRAHALAFAGLTGISGIAILASQVRIDCTTLSARNVSLRSCVFHDNEKRFRRKDKSGCSQ